MKRIKLTEKITIMHQDGASHPMHPLTDDQSLCGITSDSEGKLATIRKGDVISCKRCIKILTHSMGVLKHVDPFKTK